MGIKHTQLTRVGYEYQDLVFIEILLDWYDDPSKYSFIQIEVLGSENKSLDDIICHRTDGSRDLYQVKMTIDSRREDRQVSGKWLLGKTGKKGTSFLEKWYRDYSIGNVHKTALITNRKPDEEFKKALKNGFISFTELELDTQAKIKDQIAEPESFFEKFEFRHSNYEREEYAHRLRNRTFPAHTNELGWWRLVDAVRKWATTLGTPRPDETIRLSDLRDLFVKGISQPISQDFEIPQGYFPPQSFHSSILEKLERPGCLVISGAPGMGKSTYLSYLTQTLKGEQIVLRHHYALSIRSSTIERVNAHDVIQSLRFQAGRQISGFEANGRTEISEWLSSAVDRTPKPIVVIIDGLDHVAREQSTIAQLEHLLNRLLGFTKKICLVLGTQPVSKNDLPTKLFSVCPRKEWLEIPRMDEISIREYLTENIESDSRMTDLVEAFSRISRGYPLYLLYTIRQLHSTKTPIRPSTINQLPHLNEDDDINGYYRLIWENLDSSDQELAILIFTIEFSWPDQNAIRKVFSQDNFGDCFSKIEFLFEETFEGVRPFHSSFVVFVRSTDAFKNQRSENLDRVLRWLNTSAPEYWRWRWRWLLKSDQGDSEPLLSGLTREWLVDSVVKGYPLREIKNILNKGELAAFSAKRFDDLVRIHLVNRRTVADLRSLQTQQYFGFLTKCYEKMDKWVIRRRIAEISNCDVRELAIISSSTQEPSVRQLCVEEVNARLDVFYEYGVPHTVDELIESTFKIILNQDYGPLKIPLQTLKRFKDYNVHLVIETLFDLGKYEIVLGLPSDEIPQTSRNLYDRKFVLTCCAQDISFTAHPRRSEIKSSLGNILFLLDEKPNEVSLVPPKETFFNALEDQLRVSTKIDKPNFTNNEKYLEEFFSYSAHEVANAIRLGSVDFWILFEIFEYTEFDFENASNLDRIELVREIEDLLIVISLELFIVLKGRDIVRPLTCETAIRTKEFAFWNGYVWFRAATQAQFDIPVEFGETILKSLIDELYCGPTDMWELVDNTFEIAFFYSLIGSPKSDDWFEKATHHMLGYGARKDTTISEVYDAIEACFDHDQGKVKNWLEKIAPLTRDIAKITERNINHIPEQYLRLLSWVSATSLVDEFEDYTNRQQWSKAQLVLDVFIENVADSSDVFDSALVRCQTSYESLTALEMRAKNDSFFRCILSQLDEFLGGRPLPPPKYDYTTEPISEKKIHNFEEVPPSEFDDFYENLDRDSVMEWIAFWAERGNDNYSKIEAGYERVFSSKNPPEVLHKSLDKLFDLNFERYGKKTARKWAILSIHYNRYWYRGWTSGSRLLEYAKIYKDEGEDFLFESLNYADGLRQWWGDIPTSLLVDFYFVIGESQKAVKITETLVNNLVNETIHLPLNKYPDLLPEVERISLDLLFLYYTRWPDQQARLLAAREIARLLDSRNREVLKGYLSYFSKLKNEVEVVDYLAILYLTEKRIFPKRQFEIMFFSSVLSDLILRDLGYFGHRIYEIPPRTAVPIKNFLKAFENATECGGITRLLLFYLKKFDEKTNLQLNSLVELEWFDVQKRRSAPDFNLFSYISNRNLSQKGWLRQSLAFNTENEILSAYLRILTQQKIKSSDYDDDIIFLSRQVLPFTKFLEPGKAPEAWPVQIEMGEALEPALQELWENSGRKILRAVGPVLRAFNGVSSDLDVVLIHSNYSFDPAEVFRELTDNIQGTHETFFEVRNVNFGRWNLDKSRRFFESRSDIEELSGASWEYWNYKWYPVSPKNLGAAVGIKLTISADSWKALCKRYKTGGFFLVAKYKQFADGKTYSCFASIKIDP